MRHKVSTGLGLALVLVLAITPASAGTADDPEITDPAGDANFVSPVTGDESDTRPASLDNADLRAVWFETAHEVIDGEPQPTALLIHIQTEGPIHPTPRGNFWYLVSATLPGCDVEFELRADSRGPDDDTVSIAAVAGGCGGANLGSSVLSPVGPSFDGNVATISFPLNHPQISMLLWPGATIDQPAAKVETVQVPFTRQVVDETAPGRSFTVGQDAPDS